jgi:isopentenyl diphosphate isomerase/L-lactate dehydrogenase-like FMN-dependent dehydrogenase
MHRRSLLRFIAGSPLLAAYPALSRLAAGMSSDAIARAEDALSVLDFETLAQKALSPAHWGYLTTGVDDDATLKANRAGFSRYQLRPRRLVDVSKVDLSTELFGMRLETPIVLAPVGAIKMYHAEGELAVARAAQTRHTLQILSTAATATVEEVAKARGGPIWFQLYLRERYEDTVALIRRAEAAGCPVLVFTVDVIPGRNLETARRLRRLDGGNCLSCHKTEPGDPARGAAPPPVVWDFARKLRDSTKMKFVIKGIETCEDARLCVKYGFDGIIVSNHGGRATETGRGAIECLPEVIEGAAGKAPVMVDGGFRRGSDVFKALALGARAIAIGRPYLWGLAAFGQTGVERVLDILRAELQLTMRQCGTRSIREISRAYVI